MDRYHELKNLLFLDIETVCCCASYEELDPRLQELWCKKANSLNSGEDHDLLFFDRGAIYAEFGKIVVIGVGFFHKGPGGEITFRVTSFYGDDERSILKQFIALLESGYFKGGPVLCAHNGKEFDFPYLCRRMILNELKIPDALAIQGKKPWEIKHIDTLELWKFGDRKSFTSLDLLAALFGIESSKDEMDGSQVSIEYYRNRNIDKIAVYCCKDVVVTAQVYLKMNLMPALSKEQIIYS